MFLNKTLGDGRAGTVVQTRADLRDLTRDAPGALALSSRFVRGARARARPTNACVRERESAREGGTVTNRCHIREVKSIFAAD